MTKRTGKKVDIHWIHVYSVGGQPATHFRIDVTRPGAKRASYIHIRFSPLKRLFATCCETRRVAGNLIVRAYYDHTDFFCVDGKGCKAL